MALLLTTETPVAVSFGYGGRAHSPDGVADVIDLKWSEGLDARLLVDADTHLPLIMTFEELRIRGGPRPQSRAEMVIAMPEWEKVAQALYFSDHRKVDGVMIPHAIIHAIAGNTYYQWTVDRARINPPGLLGPSRADPSKGPTVALRTRPARARSLVACALVWACGVAPAQSAVAPRRQEPRTATLVVTVVDPSGAVVPGATVTVSGGPPSAPQEPATRVSDGAGAATFAGLAAGTFTVSVDLPGFKQESPLTVRLNGAERRVTVHLALANLQQTVTVGRTESRTGREANPFSRTLTPLEIAQLPDDPVALEEALRQMAGPGAVITVDGFRRGMLPPKSAIALITIKWADLSAETHSHSSVVVEIITKPGAESLEGYGTVGFQPAALSANDPFDDIPSATTDEASLMISAPFWKGRTSGRAYVRAGFERDPAPVTAAVSGPPHAGDTVESTTRTAAVDWQVTHQFGPTAFLRVGGTSDVRYGRNLGVGGLDLPERAYASDHSDHSVRLSLIAGRDARLFNQLRISARRIDESWDPVSNAPAVVVSGAFVSGGAQRSGSQRLDEWGIEDDLDLVQGAHAFRIGGSIEKQVQHSREFVNQQGTYTFSDTDAYVNGRPMQLVFRVGDPSYTWTGIRGGAYVQDNLRLGDSLALGMGLRCEWQRGAKDRWNIGPRLRASWTPLKHPGTKLLGGIGWYYTWIEPSVFTTALAVDGVRQFDAFVIDPGYPTPTDGDDATVLPPSWYALSPTITLGRVRRIAVGLERQLGSGTLSVTADDSTSANGPRGINWNPPGADGARPDPASGNITAVESIRRSSLRTLRTEFRTRGPRVSLLTFRYDLRWAKDDADGAFSLPADNARPEADWGPAAGDVRHQFAAYALAPITPRLVFTVFALAGSGAPYNVTTGRDDNGDTVVNDRPSGVSRNSARGGATVMADCRITWRVFGQAVVPGGGEISGASVSKQSLSIVLAVRNVFNRTNFVGYSGVVGSPLFGQPLGALPKRRVDIGLSYSF